MKFLESDEQGNQVFTFEHSADYQVVQRQFFEAVETMHPDYIVVSGLILTTLLLECVTPDFFTANFEQKPLPHRQHATAE